jgi:hypothetical protein
LRDGINLMPTVCTGNRHAEHRQNEDYSTAIRGHWIGLRMMMISTLISMRVKKLCTSALHFIANEGFVFPSVIGPKRRLGNVCYSVAVRG